MSGGSFGGSGGTVVPDAFSSTRAGSWYTSTTVTSPADNFLAPTQDRLYATLPRIATTALSIDSVSVDLNVVGTAGSVLRAGVYLINDSANPFNYTFGVAWATLLVDGGTTATDGSTGRKTLVFPTAAVVPAGRAFTIAAVDQIAGPASRRMRTAPLTPHPWGMEVNSYTAPRQVLSMAGVTGALPASFVPAQSETMISSSDHGVQWRRSA